MKIKTKILASFLRKMMMTKSQIISECIWNFCEDGLKIIAQNESAMCRIDGLLKKSAFTEYEPIGKIGIGEFLNVIKIIERFGEEVSLKTEGNLLTVKQTGKSVDIELMDSQYINVNDREMNIAFDDTFVLEAKKLHEILDDVQLNDDAEVRIVTESGKLKITNTGRYKFCHVFESISCKGGVNLRLGKPFVDAVSELDDNLKFFVKTDFPLKVLEETNDTKIELIIAPLVGE